MICQLINEQRLAAAANLRMRLTHTVGLVICEITNPFYAELAAGIDDALDQAGWVAFVANTAESLDRQDRFLQRMREQNVDGVVLCPAEGSTLALLRRLEQWRLPCVEALRFVPGSGGDYAGADYQLGMEHATEHLIRLGHRRIAFIAGTVAHSATESRRAGFIAAMRRHQLATDLILKLPATRQGGAEAAGALLDRVCPATAAVCYNDIAALGLMVGLRRRGIVPGQDFAVVGMDDVAEAGISYPALTTVATFPRLVGEQAANLLLRRIASPLDPPERSVIATRLMVRQSCGTGATAAEDAA